MSEDYRALAVFVAIEECGSFSAAGRSLKLSKSAVSHHIAKLEQKLGVSLFFRSSRKLSLTPEGRTILADAKQMVEAGARALDAVNENAEQPVGSLRVTAPAFGENTPLRQAIWGFAKKYPMVAISLVSSDEQVDLVKQGLDLAIRVGRLNDSSMRCRRISNFNRIIVAAPDYVAKIPPVRQPKDLLAGEFISIAALPDQIVLIRDGIETYLEAENVRLEVDTVTAAKSAILAGLGYRVMPLHEVKEDVDQGNLVQLLPDWELPVQGIYAVWPDTSTQKKLTRKLIDFLVDMNGCTAPDTAPFSGASS